MATSFPYKPEDLEQPCGSCTFFPRQSLSHSHSLGRQTISSTSQGGQNEYTDADFARDLQGLSFQERERVNEDIHLVTHKVEETEDFVNSKVNDLIQILKNLSKKTVNREAWDNAVFLRPTLAKDRDHHLMFLRAKNYDTYDAAISVVKFYETKRLVWGDELLARRICWDDLSEESRFHYRRAYIVNLPRNKESTCRRVWYSRATCIVEPNVNPMDYLRGILYRSFANDFGNDELQRRGLICINDLRGNWKMSTMQFLEFARDVTPMIEAFPTRLTAIHFLVAQNHMGTLARTLQSLLSRTARLRVRIHAGSWMEIQYSLRSYGIDIAADWLEGDVDGSPFSSEAIQKASQEYVQIEEEWKRKEAPYCDPASDVALFPNPQDIIMGKNRNVASLWPGNIAYTALIRKQAVRYGAADSNHEKMAIAVDTLLRLKNDRARFLARKEDNNIGWETLSYEDARIKVSQSLRDEYRKMSKPDW